VAKTRVHELAKTYGIESKEVLDKLKEMGEFVKSASSTIELPVEMKFKKTYGDALLAAKATAEPAAPAEAPAEKPAAKKAAPKKAAASVEDAAPASSTRWRPASRRSRLPSPARVRPPRPATSPRLRPSRRPPRLPPPRPRRRPHRLRVRPHDPVPRVRETTRSRPARAWVAGRRPSLARPRTTTTVRRVLRPAADPACRDPTRR
jgi:translation initiation factor IF-2